MTMPPPSALKPRVTARLDRELYDELRELAGDRDMNAVVTEAIQAWITTLRAPKPSALSISVTPQPVAPVIAPADQPWHAYRVPPRRLGA
jgi:hypothetical protein